MNMTRKTILKRAALFAGAVLAGGVLGEKTGEASAAKLDARRGLSLSDFDPDAVAALLAPCRVFRDGEPTIDYIHDVDPVIDRCIRCDLSPKQINTLRGHHAYCNFMRPIRQRERALAMLVQERYADSAIARSKADAERTVAAHSCRGDSWNNHCDD